MTHKNIFSRLDCKNKKKKRSNIFRFFPKTKKTANARSLEVENYDSII